MARSGRKPYAILKEKKPQIHRKGMRLGKTVKSAEISPQALGVGSQFEVKIYQWLKKNNIPFDIQRSYDGGGATIGGQVADFVLLDRKMIVEADGPWHDLPGAIIRDDRKRERRRGEGYTVVSIHWSDEPNLDNVLAREIGRAVM